MATPGATEHPVIARNVSAGSPMSSVSSSETQSVRSAILHSHKASSNSASDLVDVTGLLASAASAEDVISKLAKEKQALAAQNAQLWNLIQKQRDMVKGLNRDLERALKDKERYRKKLKDHLSQIPPLPSITQRANPSEGRQDSQSPAGACESEEGQSPSSTISVRDLISNGLRDKASSSSLQNPSSAEKPNVPAVTSPNRPPSLDTLASTSTTSSKSQGPTADVVLADDTALKARPAKELPHQTRKAPPAPLNLVNHGRKRSPSQPMVVAHGETAGSGETSGLGRGRRQTREDDDKQREALAVQGQDHRSRSHKDKKSKSKSTTPVGKHAAKEQSDVAVPLHVGLPFGFHPSQGLPTSPRAMQLSPLQPHYSASITAQLNSAFQDKHSGIQGSILVLPPKSPGLPISPRPIDRPLNSPMPRLPKQPVPAAPMTASFPGLPLSPRAPKQPILPPPTPLLSSASPHLVRAATYQQQSAQQSHLADPLPPPSSKLDLAVPGGVVTASCNPNQIHRGLMNINYPGLLLPPDALSSVDVKVFSSRLKPSRNSFHSGTQKASEENPVLTFAINCKSRGKQFWRIEKTVFALFKLDSQLRSLTNLDLKAPDKTIFIGHAPAKVDARRAALNDYLDSLLGYQWQGQAALSVCEFLSTDAIEPQLDDGPASASRATVGDVTLEKANKEGYLTKKGKNFGGWKVRYFTLEGADLRYLDWPGGTHLGTIKLQHAQIGKQQQPSAWPAVDKDENCDDQFRHAFVILERSQKDHSSLVRHVLCAENDEERDAWVDAVLRHVDQVPIADDEQSTTQSADLSHARPDSGEQEHPIQENPDLLQGLNYADMVAAEAPLFGAPPMQLGSMPPPPLNGFHLPGHHSSSSKSSHPAISGPTNGAVIQDAEAWGNKKEKELRKRSIFGFKGRSSSDGASISQALIQQTGGIPPVNEYTGLPRPAFGVPLTEAVQYSSPVGVDVYLPAVVYRCIEYLHAKEAASEEGIFRLSGSHVVTKGLRDRFNNEGDVRLLDGQYYDIHAVASLLKTYLRELPATVLTRELQIEFLKVLDLDDVNDRLAVLNILARKLPRANAELLRALFSYLLNIVNNAEVNKMNIRNVGIVFAPTLNIAAPLISHFLSDFDAIFGSAVTRSSTPIYTAPTNKPATAGVVQPSRRHVSSEVTAQPPSQTSHHLSSSSHNQQSVNGAHLNSEAGVMPYRHSDEQPLQAHNLDSGGYPILASTPAPGNAKETRVKRRESGMVLLSMGLGVQRKSSMPQLRHDGAVSMR